MAAACLMTKAEMVLKMVKNNSPDDVIPDQADQHADGWEELCISDGNFCLPMALKEIVLRWHVFSV